MKNNLYIKQLEYSEILPYWEILWRDRQRMIQFSAMKMMGGYDPEIKNNFKWRGYSVVDSSRNNKIIGVNSGHKSSKRDYRTRGLWVSQSERGTGVAQKLFEQLETQAKNEKCRYIWSFPRLAALPSYQKAGYESYGESVLGEFDHCVRAKKDLSLVTTTIWNLFDNPLENQKWLDNIDEMESNGSLLGQNEEVRDNFIHITQHWVNDVWAFPEWGLEDKMKPLRTVRGLLKNPAHVL